MTATLKDLCETIIARRNTRYAMKRKRIRQGHPRASGIGDCAREIYHQVKDWELQPEASVELMQRFERGNVIENVVMRELLEDGWAVIETQFSFEIREEIKELGGKKIIICTGHMDGRIGWHDGLKPVIECKSLNPNVYARINSAEDFIRMGGFWRKYPRQMLLYLLHASEPDGMWILDDCLGHWKLIPIHLMDWLDECEEALQLARKAAVAVETGQAPDFHTDPRVCRECWAREKGLCFPPMLGTDPIAIIDNPDIIAALPVIEELRLAGTRYAGLVEDVKAYGKALVSEREPGSYRYVAGEYAIDVDKRETKKGTATYVTWERLNGSG